MKSGTYFLSEFILQLHMSNGPTKEWGVGRAFTHLSVEVQESV